MASYRYSTQRKPFFRKWWFLCFVILIFIVLAGGVFGYRTYLLPLQKRAESYDLSELEKMGAATLIYDRNHKVMGRIFVQNRQLVPLEDFPLHLLQAVIAAEDNRFYKHKGIDPIGVARAFFQNLKADRITQGGSTLTMQLARNSFSLTERSYERKLVEIFLSYRIERQFSKNKILELYLNRVYFGAGFYGVEAAARGYFHKSARDLTLSESAMLCGLLKSPNNLSPWSNRQASVNSRDTVLRKMLDLKMISQEAYDQAINEDLAVKNRTSASSESYVLEYIRQQVVSLLGYENAASDGYRVYTTVDSDLQTEADNSMTQHLAQEEARDDWEHETYEQYENYLRKYERENHKEAPKLPDYLQGAFIVLNNQSGAILALSGGRNFHHSEYDRALYSKRPPGTAFTPLVFAAAFEKGFFPGSILEDTVMDNRQVMIGGTTGILGEWGSESEDNRFEGDITARRALVASKNAATVRLGIQTGLDNVITLAAKSGIETEMRPYPATFLGSSEVTLEDLALAYTMFPQNGFRAKRTYIIDRIVSSTGEVIFQEKPEAERVLSATAAYQVNSCLQEVMETGTADRAKSELGLKHVPVGGKTGTAYKFTDLWFMGYDQSITVGVWVGFDHPRTIYRGAFSKDIALPVWVDIMNATFEKYPAQEMEPPQGLERVEICTKSGMRAMANCFEETTDPVTHQLSRKRSTVFEWVAKGQLPEGLCYIHGGGEPPVLTHLLPQGEGQWPRAMAAIDTSQLKPVKLQAPTVIGDDPYSAEATMRAKAAAVEEAMHPKEEIQVRRAEPVRPLDQATEESVLKPEPPKPLKF